MKNFALAIIGLLFCHNMLAQVERDKALHYVGGSLYGLAGAGIASQISDGNRLWTFIGSVGSSAVVGVAKEAIDSGKENNRWDNQDLLATVLGGLTVGVTVDLFTNYKKRKAFEEASTKSEVKLTYVPLQLNELEEMPTLTFLANPSLFQTN